MPSASTDVTSQKRGRPGYDRESMLDVIVEVFTDRGYDAASLDLIARRLGLSKSAVYHHFASKEEMLELALERALHPLEAVFDSEGASAGTASERIRHVLRGAVLVACAERPALTLLLRLHGNTGVELRALERRRTLDARLTALFAESASQGTLRDDLNPKFAARFSFGLVNSLVEWYRPDGEITPDELAEAIISFARTGLRVSETGDFR